MNTKKERAHYIDIAKGLLILALLITHFSIVLSWSNINTAIFSPLFYIQPTITTFFMQCFFFMTGFCSNFEVEPKIFCIKLLKQIILPQLFLGFLYCCMYNISDIEKADDQSPCYFTTFWFLNSLIISKSLVYIINKFVNKEYHSIPISLLLLFIGVAINEFDLISDDGINLRHGLIACFFVSLGLVAKKRNNVYLWFLQHLWVIYPIIIALCYSLNIQHNIPMQDANIKVSLTNIPFFLVTTITGICFCLKLCMIIGNSIFIEHFGKNSLIVYCLHIVPFYWITSFLYKYFNPSTIYFGILFFSIAFVIEIFIMEIFILILSQKPLTYLSGKWK